MGVEKVYVYKHIYKNINFRILKGIRIERLKLETELNENKIVEILEKHSFWNVPKIL